MSAQPLDELFASHGGPWTEAEWLVLPESMGRVELLGSSSSLPCSTRSLPVVSTSRQPGPMLRGCSS